MFNEVHSSHGHTLLLITKPSLQATALLQHLKQSLAITGKLHNIQRSLEDISAGCIVLMDMMEADKKLIHYWQDNFVGRQLFLHGSEMLQTHRQVNNDAAYGRFGDFALR